MTDPFSKDTAGNNWQGRFVIFTTTTNVVVNVAFKVTRVRLMTAFTFTPHPIQRLLKG